jgi:Kef-type K+ transport system membrane component KefB
MSVEEAGGFPVERFLFALALILITSKVFGELAERIKQPAVLGELIAGVVLGGSVLAVVPSLPGQAGYETFHLIAEVGVAILLFEIGLETNLRDLIRVGFNATLVAVVGVAIPFAAGFLSVLAFEKFGLLGNINPAFTTLVAITAGATLTATSVGITARVLSDMNRLQTEEARIVLGAAVIDDILGLIILAIVSGLIQAAKQGVHEGINIAGVGIIALKAFGFLFVAIVVGNLLSKRLFDLINKMRVRGVLVLSALSFALIFAYIAKLVGLAPIVGAFTAGLVLARTNQFKIIETQLKPVADVFTPVFFYNGWSSC